MVKAQGEDFHNHFEEDFGPVLFFFRFHNDDDFERAMLLPCKKQTLIFLFIDVVDPHQRAGEGGYFPERDEDGFVYLSFWCDKGTTKEQDETSDREEGGCQKLQIETHNVGGF